MDYSTSKPYFQLSNKFPLVEIQLNDAINGKSITGNYRFCLHGVDTHKSDKLLEAGNMIQRFDLEYRVYLSTQAVLNEPNSMIRFLLGSCS